MQEHQATVGRIMVLCVSHQYMPVLALRTSQSLQVRNPTTGMLFLIGFTKTHFLHPPNYGYVGGQCVKLLDISVTILLFTYERNYTDYVTIHFIFFFPQFSIARLRFIPIIPSFSYFILIPSHVPSIR